MSRRKDRERAEGGMLFRGGSLVPEAQVKKGMSQAQLNIELFKEMTVIGKQLFRFRHH